MAVLSWWSDLSGRELARRRFRSLARSLESSGVERSLVLLLVRCEPSGSDAGTRILPPPQARGEVSEATLAGSGKAFSQYSRES